MPKQEININEIINDELYEAIDDQVDELGLLVYLLSTNKIVGPVKINIDGIWTVLYKSQDGQLQSLLCDE